MNALTVLFILIVGVIGLWLFITAPRHLKIPALLFICAAYVGIYGGLAGIMGTPRPILLPEEARVIAYHFNEPDWIYLWVMEEEPLNIRIPWDAEKAKHLYQAGQEAEGKKVGLMMNRGVPEGEHMFYPEPPHENPPK